MSGLRRLWRGELSLRITFWIYGIGVVWLFSFLPLALTSALRVVFPDFPDCNALKEPCGAAMFIAWVAYFYFILVAITRSALNYKSAWKFKGVKVWAILVKILAWIYVIMAGIGGLILLEGFGIIFGS